MKRFKLFGLITFLALAVAPVLTACPARGIDYVSQCKLETRLNYKEHTFLDDGIGEVVLKQGIDGDTAHFYQKETDPSKVNSHGYGRVAKIRFYGIDTPESTGKIEPFGKMASEFTKTKLDKAKTIVLSVDIQNIGHAAEFDSTGSRYVGFVWVSEKENAATEDLKLLNLWVVQDGFSNAKSITESPLAQYFLDADMQAQKLKRGMWSGKDKYPPKAEAVTTTIKEVMTGFDDEGEETSWNGAKVRLQGTVYKVVGTDCYLNVWEKDAAGVEEQFGIFVFAGYKNYKPLKELGAVIEVVGIFQVHFGNPQITNVAYDSLHPGPDNMKVITEAKNNPDGIKIPTVECADVVDNKLALNTVVKMEGLTATGGYNEVDATTLVASGAMSVYAQDSKGGTITFRIPDSVWVVDSTGMRVETYEYFMTAGLTFDVTGAIALFESTNGSGKVTYQITFCNKNDLVVHVAA